MKDNNKHRESFTSVGINWDNSTKGQLLQMPYK